MTPEEQDIHTLTPWSASTMALMSLSGVKFKLITRIGGVDTWHAHWKRDDEYYERHLCDRALWQLVHKVALAWGPKS